MESFWILSVGRVKIRNSQLYCQVKIIIEILYYVIFVIPLSIKENNVIQTLVVPMADTNKIR